MRVVGKKKKVHLKKKPISRKKKKVILSATRKLFFLQKWHLHTLWNSRKFTLLINFLGLALPKLISRKIIWLFRQFLHLYTKTLQLSYVHLCSKAILREIKFGKCRVSKTAILTILAAQNYGFIEIFSIFKCRIFSKLKIQNIPNSSRNGTFWAPGITQKSEWQKISYFSTLWCFTPRFLQFWL